MSYTQDQQRCILDLARQAVEAALRGGRLTIAADPAERYLEEPRGCFVTLHDRTGRLRGCIGTFEASRPLRENLAEMGGAVTRDPRFVSDPVTLRELPDLVIEVSVLTPMQPMDDPLDFRVGVDGIYMIEERDGRRTTGCFLPQVAPEQGWDAEQTLSYCCAHKMGLAADAWRTSPTLRCFRFQADVMSETP